MHIRCVGLSYSTTWMLQTFLPVVYLAYAVISVFIAWVLSEAALRQWMNPFVRRGWLPRVDFSIKSLLDSYLPNFLLYMHIYFISGLQKSLEPLYCTQLPDGSYFLRVSPSIMCYEQEHWTLLVLDAFALVLYGVLCPLGYFYVFLHLVPMKGLDNIRLHRNFGFVWNRFEKRCYWWEGANRKLMLSH